MNPSSMLAPSAASGVALEKTTPGDWEVSDNGYAVYTRGHRLVASVEVSELGRANAKLISVSKEMKETLEQVEAVLAPLFRSGAPVSVAEREGADLLMRVRDVLQRSEWP